MNPESTLSNSQTQSPPLNTSSQPHLNLTSPQNPSVNSHHIKRTKKHEAILKIKQVQEHIDIMKKRHKYLEVKDEENRSKTIQHQRKIELYHKTKETKKKDRLVIERDRKSRMEELEQMKEKNLAIKEDIEKKVAQSLQKYHTDRVQSYQKIKKQHEKNQQKLQNHKSLQLKQKQQKRNSILQMQQISKTNISRFKQLKQKQSNQYKQQQYQHLIAKATNRQKQLSKLSKLQEQMIKKNSESMQVSQIAKNRLREIYGEQRRYIKLPSINSKNNSHTTRGSTGNTQVLTAL